MGAAVSIVIHSVDHTSKSGDSSSTTRASIDDESWKFHDWQPEIEFHSRHTRCDSEKYLTLYHSKEEIDAAVSIIKV